MTFGQLFKTDAVDDVLLLELRDGVSSLTDHSMLGELEKIREQRRRIGLTKVIIDLAQAPFFGSSLLEFIRVIWNDLQANDGQLVLCNASPVGREVLEVANFHQVWPLLDTRHQAFDRLSPVQNLAIWPESLRNALTKYEQGPTLLRESVEDLTSIQVRTPAPPGAWSALQVVCHIADFELVYADRIKRVVAEDQPTLFGGDPDLFAARLAYQQRDINEELDVITAVRREVSRILKTLAPSDFERVGLHSTDGPLTLETLLTRIAGHIPHHVQFIEAKKAVLYQQ